MFVPKLFIRLFGLIIRIVIRFSDNKDTKSAFFSHFQIHHKCPIPVGFEEKSIVFDDYPHYIWEILTLVFHKDETSNQRFIDHFDIDIRMLS